MINIFKKQKTNKYLNKVITFIRQDGCMAQINNIQYVGKVIEIVNKNKRDVARIKVTIVGQDDKYTVGEIKEWIVEDIIEKDGMLMIHN